MRGPPNRRLTRLVSWSYSLSRINQPSVLTIIPYMNSSLSFDISKRGERGLFAQLIADLQVHGVSFEVTRTEDGIFAQIVIKPS